MKVFKNMLFILISLIYIFILILNLFSKTKDEELFGIMIYQIISESMAGNVEHYNIGSLEVGDYIIVKTNKDDSFYEYLEVGDVLTFKMNDGPMIGSVVTHRIVEIRYDEHLDSYSITTLGDNNDLDNVEVLNSKVDKIYGQVILSNKFINFIMGLINNYIFLVCFILIPVVLFTFYEIGQLFKMYYISKLNLKEVDCK